MNGERPIVDEIDGQVYAGRTQSIEPRLFAIALEALSARALVWVSALGAGAMWGVAIAHPDVLRLIASVGYCGTVLVPILVRDARGG